MESFYTELGLYGSNNECARTDNVFSSISEVCDCMVSLTKLIWLSMSTEELKQNILPQGGAAGPEQSYRKRKPFTLRL